MSGVAPAEIARLAGELCGRGFGTLECSGAGSMDALLGGEDVAGLRDECERELAGGGFRPARVGRVDPALHSGIRSDRLRWLDPLDCAPPVARYFAAMDALRLALNRALFLGLDRLEAHFSVYEEGAFYAPHVDRFAGDETRIVSTVLYLNREWPAGAGGELRLHLPGGDPPFADIAPRGGALVLFLSDQLVHEVLPAGRQRLSIAGWLLARR